MAFEFESLEHSDENYFSVIRKTINGTLSFNYAQDRSIEDQIEIDNNNLIEVKVFREDYTVEPRHDLGFYVVSITNSNPDPTVSKFENCPFYSVTNLHSLIIS